MNQDISASALKIFASTPLQLLVIHTAWANRQLFAALGAVPDFESQKGADLIVRALDHIHVVRRIFQAHLQDARHDYTSTQSPALPTLASSIANFRPSTAGTSRRRARFRQKSWRERVTCALSAKPAQAAASSPSSPSSRRVADGIGRGVCQPNDRLAQEPASGIRVERGRPQ